MTVARGVGVGFGKGVGGGVVRFTLGVEVGVGPWKPLNRNTADG